VSHVNNSKICMNVEIYLQTTRNVISRITFADISYSNEQR